MSRNPRRPLSVRLRLQCVNAAQQVQALLARSRHKAGRSEIADEAVASLRSEGVYMTTVDRLLGAAGPACQEAMAAAARLLEAGAALASPTWQLNGASTDLAAGELLARLPALFLFGLDETVLAIAEQYLRVPVAYHGAVFRHSRVDGRQVGPRLWHRDAEDFRVLRTVLYLNDVAEGGGPFEYVPRHVRGADPGRLARIGQCTDEQMAILVPPPQWKRCIGPAGTVVLADSARVFHHESLQRRADRSVVMMGHASRRPKDRALAMAHFPVEEHAAALARLVAPEHHALVFGWRGLDIAPSGSPPGAVSGKALVAG